MITKKGSTQIVNFMTPGAGVLALGCGHISHIMKIHYSLKNLLLYSQALVRQTKYKVMMTFKGRVYPNCKFHDPRGKDSCARVWPYIMHYFFKNLLLYTHA